MNKAIVTLCTALLQILIANFNSLDKTTNALAVALSNYIDENEKWK